MYSEIVPRTMPFAEMQAMQAEGDHPLGWSRVGARRRRAVGRPRALRRRRAAVRHLLRRAAARPRPRRHRRQDRPRRVRPHRAHRGRTRAALPRAADRAGRVDEPLRHDHRGADRRPGARVDGRHARRPRSATPTGAIYGVQFHPEVAHTEHGQEVLKAFLFDVAECRPTWTNVSIIEEAVAEIRAQVGTRAGDLRALRRGRLRGRGRDRAQGGRRPAHVRVRRHRAAAAWARPSRWRRRSSASSTSTSCT